MSKEIDNFNSNEIKDLRESRHKHANRIQKLEILTEDMEKNILTKLDGLKELIELRFDQNDKEHIAVNEHLKKLNGQVIKNTYFRVRGSVYVGIFAFIVPFLITYFLR